jgi:hypothetical protein
MASCGADGQSIRFVRRNDDNWTDRCRSHRQPGRAACRGERYDVVISNSRGPETLSALVGELGPRARAGTAVDAAKAGDIVVVTVPLKNYRAVPVEPLAGKIVIETNNYYPQRDGHIPELEDESTTTSELLQRHLPTSKVVKGFNHIYAARATARAERPRSCAVTSRRPSGTQGSSVAITRGETALRLLALPSPRRRRTFALCELEGVTVWIMRPCQSLPGLVVRRSLELDASCRQLLVESVEIARAELHVGAGAHRRGDALGLSADGILEREQADGAAALPADANEGEVRRRIDDDLEAQRLVVELQRPPHARDRQGEPVQVNIDGHGGPDSLAGSPGEGKGE